MIVQNSAGEEILALPGSAKCRRTGKSPLEMNFCPRRDFDDQSVCCVPEICQDFVNDPPEGEDKRRILVLLLLLLQQTRGGADIDDMVLKSSMGADEFVEIRYRGGGRRAVDVTADSALGMIKDVVEFVCKH